ncbi:RNA polymerase sigma factor [Sphingobium chlorophenolicum]|nr:sigma-70 family RNA polymerase sigma factor [Sphingobium chlorophenolicum]
MSAKGAALAESDPLPPDFDRLSEENDSLAQIYRQERPGLLRFLSRWATKDRAEDIVQQVFSRMAAKPQHEHDAISAPGAYLRRAASNLLRDEAKSACRTRTADDILIEDLALTGSDPVAVLEARDRLARIEQAVLRLKPMTREIFLACRLDGYSYAEIAARTGLSVKGVERQMSRAIKQLGRHLRAHD